MNLAQRALEADDVGLAVSLLNKHRPGGKAETRKQKSEIDLRGWEWRYLWQLCQPDMSFSLRRDSAPVGAVAVSRDGRLLAVQTGGDKVDAVGLDHQTADDGAAGAWMDQGHDPVAEWRRAGGESFQGRRTADGRILGRACAESSPAPSAPHLP